MVSDGFRVVPEHEAAAQWDDWLSEFENRAIRQSHAWGRHKTGGWTPLYTAFFNKGEPAAMALLLTRRAPLGAATLAWANAGPVFRDPSSLSSILHGLTEHFRGVPRAILRVAPRVASTPALEAALRDAAFSPARSALDSGRTVIVDLRRDVEVMRAALDKKWRNQLKKAEAASPIFEFGRSSDLLERVLRLHDATRKRKRLKDGIDLPMLERAVGDFGPALTFLVGSVGGVDGCAMSWWNFSGRATLWLSAVNENGMNLCLPNAAYWEATVHLRDEGAESFDLSGIDAKLNPGVTHFKLGAGGTEVVTAGEWDWSASALPRAAFNALLGAVRARMPR